MNREGGRSGDREALANGLKKAPVNGAIPDEGPSGVFLRVVPNARKTEVVGVHGGAIKLKVSSPALEGKANAAVLEFVAATAGVPGRAAVLLAGEKSRDKVVRVEGMTAHELKRRLLAASEDGE